MKIWTVQESETQTLQGLNIADFPAVAYNYLSLQVSPNRDGFGLVKVATGPYVGSFPLLNGDNLLIQPRVGRSCFWRMLVVAEGLENVSRTDFERFTQIGANDSGQSNWIELLARPFAAQLRGLEKMSLRAGRIKCVETSATAKGRIHPFATVRNLFLRQAYPIEYTTNRRTYLIPENMVLAEAARRLLNEAFLPDEDRLVLARWSKRFGDNRATSSDVRQVIQSLAANRYTGSRAYYIPPLLIAQLLLSGGSISFDAANATYAEAFLTNMRTLFEKYIRAVLSRDLGQRDYLVEKRTIGDTLFKDGTCQLIPDVIISKNGHTKLLVDAKYKIDAPVEPADYYQMQAYLTRYGVKDGLIVFPTERSTDKPLRSRELVGGGFVHELRLPLTEWQKAEAILAQSALALIG